MPQIVPHVKLMLRSVRTSQTCQSPVKEKVDTIIIVGNSTSGCVRARAVDAKQRGFSVVIPEERVFDRIEASHEVGLLDLWMKYAVVISKDEVLAYLRLPRK